MRCWAAFFYAAALVAAPRSGGELRLTLRSDPKTLDPFLVADEHSETVRFLTGGVLLRVNRKTQRVEPELAQSWKVSEHGRRIVFELRRGVKFSDGSPMSADDVAFTIRHLMDPELRSPTGDSFRSGTGSVQVDVLNPQQVSLRFPAAVAGIERLFDQVAIVAASGPDPKRVLGPFVVTERKAGAYLRLSRNPNYWKKDREGRALPYLEGIRFDIQQNRETELVRFRRGETHAVFSIDAEMFERLTREASGTPLDAGPSFEPEMLWFNQVRAAPLPDYKKAWFQSAEFRRAVSQAIQREDICRLAFRGHAVPAAGPASRANLTWFNQKVKPHPFDPNGALNRLKQAGFRLENETLRDSAGHAVEFSIVTNSGNRARARIAAMIQQDLVKLGIKVTLVPLDFPSLIERISKTYQYEACLLGLVNIDPDPNGQMSVWLSSSAQHQWNPNQKSPETRWEAEIDRLMREQASTVDPKRRKAAFDRVQEIASEQAPFVYLVEKNYLAAVSPSLRNVEPAALRPQILWNAEMLYLETK
ncbi:MAG: ABC transporter substrate-binding protein [Bryobacteraceae bacterium]